MMLTKLDKKAVDIEYPVLRTFFVIYIAIRSFATDEFFEDKRYFINSLFK